MHRWNKQHQIYLGSYSATCIDKVLCESSFNISKLTRNIYFLFYGPEFHRLFSFKGREVSFLVAPNYPHHTCITGVEDDHVVSRALDTLPFPIPSPRFPNIFHPLSILEDRGRDPRIRMTEIRIVIVKPLSFTLLEAFTLVKLRQETAIFSNRSEKQSGGSLGLLAILDYHRLPPPPHLSHL